MVVVPIADLMDYERCYSFLAALLHPAGLHCPGCQSVLPPHQRPHKLNSTGLPSFRCRSCGRVFNLYTKTALEGIHYRCVDVVLMLRGFVQGKTTLHLSRELSLNYKNLLSWRHRLQEFAYENRACSPLNDEQVESDEVFINAGQKGQKHSHPDDPPRVRANKKKA